MFSEFLNENKSNRLAKKEEEIKLVSFDMDNTLSFNTYDGAIPRPTYVQAFKDHLNKGRTVIIVTSRQQSTQDREQISDFLDDNGLPESEVYYTNSQLKADSLVKLGVDLHYDDDNREISALGKTNIDYIVSFDDDLVKLYQQEDGISVNYDM